MSINKNNKNTRLANNSCVVDSTTKVGNFEQITTVVH